MRLLIVRPFPDAERTAAALRARGHAITIAPIVEIQQIAKVDLAAGPWSAFLLTSANALSGLAGHTHRQDVRSVPVFTVGERTARAIRERGFAAVTSADGDVNDLASLIARRVQPPARLLYLAGEERAGDLAGDLQTRGYAVDTVVAYRAVAALQLPQAAAEALRGGIDGVLHYSLRSAEAYVNAARRGALLGQALAPVQFCLSIRVSEPLAAAGAAAIAVATRPNEAALLELIGPGGH